MPQTSSHPLPIAPHQPAGASTAIAPEAGPTLSLANVERGTIPGGVVARMPADPGAHGLAPDRMARAAELVGIFTTPQQTTASQRLLGLYDALRRARIAGCTEVFARTQPGDATLANLMDLRPVVGSERSVTQRLDVAIARTAAAIGDHATSELDPNYLAAEVARHLEGFFERIYASRWFRAVYDQTITRGQYVYTLSNMHQFVRFTTRILGRCVATADDPSLRVHFIRHLSEEVNHELIIERDLAAMGEDVAYVRDRMPPNLATRQFMAAQESAIAFHRDPVLLMAAPLAAEGISGHLDQAFLDALHDNARGWGVDDPTRITRFYASHMDFDGGDDGHWEGTVKMLAAHLTDETKLARFLSVLAATTHAMERCYDSWIDDVRLG
ncbi:MAG: hypothetical protein AAF721_35850 [Myxococcota bacterium]